MYRYSFDHLEYVTTIDACRPVGRELHYEFENVPFVRFLRQKGILIPDNYVVVRKTAENIFVSLKKLDGLPAKGGDPHQEYIAFQLLVNHFGHIVGRCQPIDPANLEFTGSTSPGYPYSKTCTTKEEALKRYTYEIYEFLTCEEDLPDILWKLDGKVEYLSKEQALVDMKIRTFIPPPVDFVLLQTMLVGEMEVMIKQSIWVTWSMLTFTKENCGWHKMWTLLDKYSHKAVWDVGGWDRNYAEKLFNVCRWLRAMFYDKPLQGVLLKKWNYMWDQLINSLFLLWTGQVFRKRRGQNSGGLTTSSDNTLAHIFILLLHFVRYCEKFGFQAVSSGMSSLWWNCVFSDDNACGSNDEKLIDREFLSETYSYYGMTIKEGSYMCGHSSVGMTYLGARNVTRTIRGRSFYCPKYPTDRMLFSLCYTEEVYPPELLCERYRGLMHNLCFSKYGKVLEEFCWSMHMRGEWPSGQGLPTVRQSLDIYFPFETVVSSFFPLFSFNSRIAGASRVDPSIKRDIMYGGKTGKTQALSQGEAKKRIYKKASAEQATQRKSIARQYEEAHQHLRKARGSAQRTLNSLKGAGGLGRSGVPGGSGGSDPRLRNSMAGAKNVGKSLQQARTSAKAPHATGPGSKTRPSFGTLKHFKSTSGDYDPIGISNRFTANTPMPSMDVREKAVNHARYGTGCCLVGSEFMLSLTVPAGAKKGSLLESFPFNPRLWGGTRVQVASQLWNRYIVKDMVLEFIPVINATVNGAVQMFPNYDPDSFPTYLAGDAAIRRSLAYQNSVQGQVFSYIRSVFHNSDMAEAYFLDPEEGDVRLLEQGVWDILAACDFGNEESITYGNLIIHYEIEFYLRSLVSPGTPMTTGERDELGLAYGIVYDDSGLFFQMYAGWPVIITAATEDNLTAPYPVIDFEIGPVGTLAFVTILSWSTVNTNFLIEGEPVYIPSDGHPSFWAKMVDFVNTGDVVDSPGVQNPPVRSLMLFATQQEALEAPASYNVNRFASGEWTIEHTNRLTWDSYGNTSDGPGVLDKVSLTYTLFPSITDH